MVDDKYKESVIGTPQGGNLSPLLANIMLNELDKEMEQRGPNFVRYADDCISMVGSEMSAKRVMRNLTKFIEEKLQALYGTPCESFAGVDTHPGFCDAGHQVAFSHCLPVPYPPKC